MQSNLYLYQIGLHLTAQPAPILTPTSFLPLSTTPSHVMPVTLDGAPLKKTVIKTTPAMSLKSIVVQSCEKLSLPNPDLYLLKNKRDTLDQSLSVRFSNLAPGAKLTLHQRSSTDAVAGSTLVDVALQLQDGGRVVDKFETCTTLWNILLHFEQRSNGALNLTRKTGVSVPSKPNSAVVSSDLPSSSSVYILPSCVFMNHEYNTITQLKSTSLSSAGLESGNGVIRVVDLYMPASIDAYLAEINTPQPKVGPSFTPTPSSKPTKTPSTIVAAPAPKPMDTPSVPIGGGSLPLSGLSAGCGSDSAIPQPKALPQSVVESPDIPKPAPTMHTQHAPPSFKQATTTTEVDTIKEKPVIEQDVHIYLPSPENMAPMKIDLPSSFFQLSPFEMKAMMASQQYRNKQASDSPLMTRAMREREDELKRQKHPRTMIRVRFPDRTTLQATYWSGDAISSVYTTVRAHLQHPDREFRLSVTPPLRILGAKETFWQAQLAPASIVYFAWVDDKKLVKGEVVLTADALSVAEAFPLPSVSSGGVTDVPTDKEMACSSEVEAVEVDQLHKEEDELIAQEEARERARICGGHSGGVRGQSVSEDTEDDASESHLATRKVPKWFRPSK
ncbi:hypothetical protein BASA61_008814 [Batrachochytrium salamandrivorans]|nr:hypothetical protein BASA61_008814 [Batrachochytrium salamandrivorans]